MARLEKDLQKLKAQSQVLRKIKSDKKNELIQKLAQKLIESASLILAANEKDLKKLPTQTTSAFRDRLTLNHSRLEGMAESLRQVAALPDPVNEEIERKILKNGLLLRKVRAPLGLIFMIFESRPNVILEAFSLAFKSGNCIILRGGRESSSTAAVIYKLMYTTFKEMGFSSPCFFGVENYDRKVVAQLLKRKDLIDIVVPRGGEKLIAYVQATAAMPIIKNDRGLCHAYVDDSAQLKMALDIVTNAKIQRPGVCNALETVLVHESQAQEFITALYAQTLPHQLEWRVDKKTSQILKKIPEVKRTKNVKLAKIKDWDTEHLDLILNCRVVKNLEEALKHIADHGSKHSETIITENEKHARLFQEEVDAAAVYWNASTRFTDGFEFGLGGELGISTQKLHVRGPVGIRELTTPRWIIDGDGQIRT